jgi:hypothetical protein
MVRLAERREIAPYEVRFHRVVHFWATTTLTLMKILGFAPWQEVRSGPSDFGSQQGSFS